MQTNVSAACAQLNIYSQFFQVLTFIVLIFPKLLLYFANQTTGLTCVCIAIEWKFIIKSPSILLSS